MSVAERLLGKDVLGWWFGGSADECGKMYDSISYIKNRVLDTGT